MLQAFVTHVRPIIDFGSVLWNTGYISDLQLLESVQRSWTKKIVGFSDLSYADRLSRLDLFSIKASLLRSDMIMVWKILNGQCFHLSDLFIRRIVAGTRGHSKKVFIPACNTDVRSRFFTVCTLKSLEFPP